MDYLASSAPYIITRERAIKEIRDHGAWNYNGIRDFLKECGNHKFYSAYKVLLWLGY